MCTRARDLRLGDVGTVSRNFVFACCLALWLTTQLCLPLVRLSALPFFEMADHGVAHAKRAARRADTVEQFLNVRQRIDDIETRLDATAARVDQHELRLGYMEACLKIVLRGFTCVQEFLRNKDTDYKLAKGAFIAAFFAELKDSCTAEANWAINEAENLAVEHDGLVLVGIFPTGRNRDGMADAALRLQSSWVGGRVSSAAPFLGEARQLFTDRVRKPKGKGKGEGQQKGKGKPKGKGGKKGKGVAAPKRAAAPGMAGVEE